MKALIDKNGFFISNYSFEWLEENKTEKINGEYVNKWKLVDAYNEDLKLFKPKWDYSLKVFVEGATSEDVNQQLFELRKKEIKLKYDFHKANGWDYYQEFRAEIVMDIDSEQITINEAFVVENFLKSAFDKIANTGDWKTAHFVLDNLYTENELLIGYKNKAMIVIAEYISKNYD